MRTRGFSVLADLGRELRRSERLVGAVMRSMPADPREMYELAKQHAALGQVEEARRYASAAARSSDRAIRYLAERRLQLMASRPPRPSSWQVSGAEPGVATTELFGPVMALGKYVAVGRQTQLTQLIQQFKKAPGEAIPGYLDAKPEIVDRLGFALAQLLTSSGLLQADLIVPVPPDRARIAERGYNVPADLAVSLSRHSLVPGHEGIVRKARSTRSLRSLPGKWERQQELRGSMMVDASRSYLVKDACVVLVDDVVTYGTHFAEISRVLLAVGARCVHGIALGAARGHVRPGPTPVNHGDAPWAA